MNSIFILLVLLCMYINSQAFAYDVDGSVNSRIKEVHTRIEQQEKWAQEQITPSHQGPLYIDGAVVEPMEISNPAISNVTPTKPGEQSATLETYQNTPRFKASDPETQFLEDSARQQDQERLAQKQQFLRAEEFKRRLKEAGVQVAPSTSAELKALGYLN
jgi:hypothetical protein